MDNFFKDKKVLITGNTGFIGKNLCIRLKELHARLYVIDHRTPVDDKLGDIRLYGDLLDKKFCKKVVTDMNYVFHCAAVTHGAKYMNENPQGLVTNNTIMNVNILDAAYKAGVKKFLFISSGTVYPDYIGEFKDENVFQSYYEEIGDINDPPDCYFGVAHMKRYGEKLCEFYSTKVKNPMTCIVLRPSNIYGKYDDYNPDTSHVMASLVKRVCDEENPLNLWGNVTRDWIYIDDFIDAMLLSMEKVTNFDIFNIGYNAGYQVKDVVLGLADIIQKKYNKDYNPEIVWNETKNATISKRLLDCSKAKKLLGFEAFTLIRDGMEKTVKWYKENKV